MDFFHYINKLLRPHHADRNNTIAINRNALGHNAETAAISWLQQRGLQLLKRNYKTPGRGGGEIDAIMRAADGTLVFIEVRLRSNSSHGGAAASIDSNKQRRIIRAAQHYLQQTPYSFPCRFDVMLCDRSGPPWEWEWLIAAFDAG